MLCVKGFSSTHGYKHMQFQKISCNTGYVKMDLIINKELIEKLGICMNMLKDILRSWSVLHKYFRPNELKGFPINSLE